MKNRTVDPVDRSLDYLFRELPSKAFGLLFDLLGQVFTAPVNWLFGSELEDAVRRIKAEVRTPVRSSSAMAREEVPSVFDYEDHPRPFGVYRAGDPSSSNFANPLGDSPFISDSSDDD